MSSTVLPKVSILLPIWNEQSYIADCLRSIFLQDYPHEKMEILIADGNSTDETLSIINMVSLESEIPISVLNNPHGIVPTGLNILFLIVKGEIIIRVDGHTVLSTDYVRQCVMALEFTGVDNVGGRMRAIGTTAFGRAVVEATSHPFGIGNSKFHYSDKLEDVDTVYLGAWPKRVFEKIGLFDEELVRNQDDEFNYRIREAGGQILLHPSIKSLYTVRSTPEALWKQYYQYGYWKVRVLQKHPRQMSLRQFIPPVFALSIFISLLLTLFFPWGWFPLTIILGLYIVVNLGFSISLAFKQ
ncbi:MAG: glycosyltransferase family 2 protein, partial [Bacteroidales bacterium]|nr:glycosyltransferase family 2 protein [Bacteroidales bacterium]